MKFIPEKADKLARFAINLVIASVVVTALLSVIHGVAYGESFDRPERGFWIMIETWCADFRYLFEQLIYVGALVFIGAKFLQTRTTLTVGFDTLDKDKVSFRGPDEDNVVWIGHKYGSRLEAQTVAETIESRLKESA